MELKEFNKKRFLKPVHNKAFASEVKVDENSRKVSFYAIKWGEKDSDGDILIKGCCAKSIAEHGPESNSPQKIMYFYQHDRKDPIGRFTLLKEDDIGLYCEAELDPDEVYSAKRTRVQYKTGTLNQHSIGFSYVQDKYKWDETLEAWIITEVILKEISVVSIAAQEGTPFMGFKAEEIKEEIVSHSKELEKELKDLDPEKADILRQLISKSVALAEAKEPIKVTPEPTEPLFDWYKSFKLITKI